MTPQDLHTLCDEALDALAGVSTNPIFKLSVQFVKSFLDHSTFVDKVFNALLSRFEVTPKQS
jgi:hypothetical protein